MLHIYIYDISRLRVNVFSIAGSKEAFTVCYILVIQGGAEETHVFHIRITLFIFNIKKSFNYTKRKVF